MTQHKATAVAGSNIALIKYWGNSDAALRIPTNNSLSMTLDTAQTTTTVIFAPEFTADELILNGKPAAATAVARASTHLDHIRQRGGVAWRGHVVSHNSFPTGAGIASSASGFAALTVAACGALGLAADHAELSRLARLGSGSACRSIDGGFVEWQAGGRHADSFAAPIAPPEHWDLVDVIAIVAAAEKDVSSTQGHALAPTSPYFQARLGELQLNLQRVRAAIFARDLAALGEHIEAEAISLHVMMMTSRPSILYWTEGTIALMHALRRWRRAGIEAYFTMDAGPNVHIITERSTVPALLEKLKEIPQVADTLVCGVGGAARLLETHLA